MSCVFRGAKGQNKRNEKENGHRWLVFCDGMMSTLSEECVKDVCSLLSGWPVTQFLMKCLTCGERVDLFCQSFLSMKE